MDEKDIHAALGGDVWKAVKYCYDEATQYPGGGVRDLQL